MEQGAASTGAGSCQQWSRELPAMEQGAASNKWRLRTNRACTGRSLVRLWTFPWHPAARRLAEPPRLLGQVTSDGSVPLRSIPRCRLVAAFRRGLPCPASPEGLPKGQSPLTSATGV